MEEHQTCVQMIHFTQLAPFVPPGFTTRHGQTLVPLRLPYSSDQALAKHTLCYLQQPETPDRHSVISVILAPLVESSV